MRPGVLVSRLDPFRPAGSVEWRPGWQPPAACAFHEHPAPDEGCRCGWRGEPDLDTLTWWLADWKRVKVMAVGRVELAGKVLTGDCAHGEIPRILRAERARVAGPVVLAPRYGQHAGALAGRYGVQVRLSSAATAAPWWVCTAARDLAWAALTAAMPALILLIPRATAVAGRRSWCSLCSARVEPGQRIALVPGRGWLHASCCAAAKPTWQGRPVEDLPAL
jgi:hypothetical protein